MKSRISRLARRKNNIAIKDLDGNTLVPVHTTEAVRVEENHHSGPIPAPQQLQEYETILPGIADRIMTMAEQNAKHIRKKEMAHLNKHFADKNVGRLIGSLLIVAVLYLAYYAIDANMPYLAALLGGSTVIGLATIFILGKKASKETE